MPRSVPISYVYFARDEKTGLIKIGKSMQVPDRMKAISWKYKTAFTLLGFLPGGLDKESELQERFAAHRQYDELFLPVPEILEFIKDNTTLEFPEPPKPIERKHYHLYIMRDSPLHSQLVDGLGIPAENAPFLFHVTYEVKVSQPEATYEVPTEQEQS